MRRWLIGGILLAASAAGAVERGFTLGVGSYMDGGIVPYAPGLVVGGSVGGPAPGGGLHGVFEAQLGLQSGAMASIQPHARLLDGHLRVGPSLGVAWLIEPGPEGSSQHDVYVHAGAEVAWLFGEGDSRWGPRLRWSLLRRLVHCDASCSNDAPFGGDGLLVLGVTWEAGG